MDILLLLTLEFSHTLSSSLNMEVPLTYLIFMSITQYQIHYQILLMSFKNLRRQQSSLTPKILGIISSSTSIQTNGY